MSGDWKLEKKTTDRGWGHVLLLETPQNCVIPNGNYKI